MAIAAFAHTRRLDGLERMARDQQEVHERLRELAEAYFSDIWRFLRSLGVSEGSLEDVAQEVFLVALNKLADVRPGAEKGFLFSTAVRVAHNQRRKYAREELAADPDDESFEPASLATPEVSFEQKHEYQLLLELLDGLPDDLRTVFVLHEIEGESIPSISATLGIPVGTATSRLRRAREKFDVRLSRPQLRMRGTE